MKKHVFILIALILAGCASTPKNATLLPDKQHVTSISKNVGEAKSRIQVVKKEIKDEKLLSDLILAETALSKAEKDIDNLSRQIDEITAVANKNYQSYVDVSKENEKLKKKITSSIREVLFWRLTFIAALIYLTRKMWLRILGIGL